MSYIYEALKRAESENARAIDARAPVRRPAFFAAGWRWWLWLLIGVLGTNAALVITLVLVRGSRSPVATTAQTGSTGPVTLRRDAELADVTPAAPPPIPPAGAAVTPTAEPPAKTVAPPVSPASHAAGRPAPAVRPSATGVESSARPSTPARAVAPSVAGVEPSARASIPTAITEARPASPPTAGATAAVSPPATTGAPPVSAAAPPSTAPTAVEEPKLKVQVVVYSDVPAQRLVFIDGRRYAEGDKVDAETVVERITPEGAVVTRRGQSFALTSGRP